MPRTGVVNIRERPALGAWRRAEGLQMVMEGRYQIAPGVELLDLDSTLTGRPVLVVKGSRYLQIGGLSKQVLLCLRDSPRTGEEISDHLRPHGGEDCPKDRLQQVLRALEDAAVIQEHREGAPEGLRISSKARRGYFLFRIPLLSENLISPITSRLSPLFRITILARLLPVMLLVQVFIWPFLRRRFGGITPVLIGWDYGVLIVGNYLGLLLHELGHASACVRSGVRHGSIGFGLYLFFPTFYTDVSEAWKLSRRQRMVVDVGGIYMSLFAATIATALYLLTGRSVYALLSAIYDLTVWVSLWPFVRMDGYWLMSDLLGVPNLMNANRELTKWLWLKTRRHPCTRPQVLSIEPRWLRAVYLLYYSLFLLSMSWLAYRLSVWYFPGLVRSLPTMAYAIVKEIHASGWSFRVVKQAISLILTITPAVALWFYISPVVKRLIWELKRYLVWLWVDEKADADTR